MKNFIIISLCVLIGIVSGTEAVFSSPANVALPSVKEIKLPNGLKGFYIKDELPQLTIVVSVGFGRLYETRKTAGLSSLLSRTLSVCGTKKYPGAKIYEKIESMGGKLSISSGWEETVIVVRVLERFKDDAFSLLGELLLNPAFTEKGFKNAKALVSDKVRRSYDDPASVAFEKTRSIIFDGKGYGSSSTVAGINSFVLSDIKLAWKKYFTAGNLKVGFLTSVSKSEVESLLKNYLSKIPVGTSVEYESNLDNIMTNLAEKTKKIYFFEKDIPQSTIVIGTVGPRIKNKAVYPLSLMNYVLGGGSFNSRLMNEIRVKRGLAYSVGSVVRARKKTGVFLAYAQTRNSAVSDVLSIMLQNTKRMSEEDMISKELNWAKKSILNSYIFNFDSPMNILNNYMAIVYNELPVNYYSLYPGNIKKTTSRGIREAAKLLFDSGLVKVVVGNKSVRKSLAKFGEVVDMKTEVEK